LPQRLCRVPRRPIVGTVEPELHRFVSIASNKETAGPTQQSYTGARPVGTKWVIIICRVQYVQFATV